MFNLLKLNCYNTFQITIYILQKLYLFFENNNLLFIKHFLILIK